jgi:uncharacterized membrane protein (UPF0127 family)
MSEPYRLLNRATGEVIVPRLVVATTFWRRFRGLLFRRGLTAGEALLLAPCGSIHTCWMRFAIDVAWLDVHGIVLSVTQGVRPWRVAYGPRDTKIAVETAAGTLNLNVGEVLAVAAAYRQAPRVLRPLLSSPSREFEQPDL